MECKNEIQKYSISVSYKKEQQMKQETIMPRVVSQWCGAEDPAQQFEACELTSATKNGSGAWIKSQCFQEKLLIQSAVLRSSHSVF
jgi:hypothetical protein